MRAISYSLRRVEPKFDFSFRDISTETIDSNLMISRKGSPPLDILVRTSGVKRLSDYMLWQASANTKNKIIITMLTCDSVLRKYTNSFRPNILATLQFLGFRAYYPGVSAKGLDQVCMLNRFAIVAEGEQMQRRARCLAGSSLG